MRMDLYRRLGCPTEIGFRGVDPLSRFVLTPWRTAPKASPIMTNTQRANEQRAEPRMARPAPTRLLHMATMERIIATEKDANPINVQHVRMPRPMQIQPALTAELLDFVDVGRGGGTEKGGHECIMVIMHTSCFRSNQTNFYETRHERSSPHP